MKELLTYIIQSLVDHPDQVSVTERKADGETVYEVRVADGFCILTAEFNSDSGFGIGCAHRKGVCHDFLDKEGVGGFGEGLTATSAEGDSKILIGEKSVGLAQHFENLLCLHGVVALVSIMQKLVGLWIDNRDLHGGGTNVHADP